MLLIRLSRSPFFSVAPPTPLIYTLSLHDALPICSPLSSRTKFFNETASRIRCMFSTPGLPLRIWRCRDRKSNTSELQSPDHLVCRLLLEKKKNTITLVQLQLYISNLAYAVEHQHL